MVFRGLLPSVDFGYIFTMFIILVRDLLSWGGFALIMYFVLPKLYFSFKNLVFVNKNSK